MPSPAASSLAGGSALAGAPLAPSAPLTALARLDIPSYMGTWYQVAWFPNRFQRQCVSDTAAVYRRRDDGLISVTNRCRLADGRADSVEGVARPDASRIEGDSLLPARLEVSFLPAWLRWLPFYGRYWVIDLAVDGRYAVVSEPSREYLWVLSRTPVLAAADESAIRSRLVQAGFDLGRWQAHPHTAPAGAPTR